MLLISLTVSTYTFCYLSNTSIHQKHLFGTNPNPPPPPTHTHTHTHAHTTHFPGIMIQTYLIEFTWQGELFQMWPGFDSQTRRHMWAEFVLVLDPAPRVFLRVLRFSSLSNNRASSLFELAVGCAPRSCMDRTAAASDAYICFWSNLVELRPCCTLRGRLVRHLLLLILLLLLLIDGFITVWSPLVSSLHDTRFLTSWNNLWRSLFFCFSLLPDYDNQ